MPYLGLGIHFLIALFFAVHAVRSGRNIFWVIILFSFPLLGSIVYFVVEYLPDMRNSRTGRAVGKAALNVIDPKRELREARHAFDLSQTNQNRMRLANALLEAGESEEAITHLNACLVGQHEHDPDVLTRLARAHMDMGDAAGTSAALNKLITHDAGAKTNDTELFRHVFALENLLIQVRFFISAMLSWRLNKLSPFFSQELNQQRYLPKK